MHLSSVKCIIAPPFGRTPRKEHIKIQCVQNFATRVFTGIRKYDHVTPNLQQLAWLPVECISAFFKEFLLEGQNQTLFIKTGKM